VELELSLLLMLGGVALLAGFIDTLAGGGGLLTLPALLLAGLGPVNALATNKLQGAFGSGMATFMLLRRRRFKNTLAGLRRPFLWSLGGSGPGTGSFFSLTGVALRGQDLVTATAQAKALNFASNIASLTLFVVGGKVLWVTGAVMIVGQMLGAWLGSHAVLRGGARLIRPLIVVVCLAMLIRYLFA
jgi:uncharacterized membrane protein YfcA